MIPEDLARFMHDEYEKVSKEVGWDTQKKCKVEFDSLPEENKKVMIKVAESVQCELAHDFVPYQNNAEKIISNVKPDYTLCFHGGDGGVVAQMDWNDGVLKYSGKMDESAEAFMVFFKPYLDEYVEWKLKEESKDER